MIDSTMLDLGCESMGMNEIVSIGVGDPRTNTISHKLKEILPSIPQSELEDNIQEWYDSLVDDEFTVSTKAAASKLITLGFARSDFEVTQTLKACGATKIVTQETWYRIFDRTLFKLALRKLGRDM